MEHMALCYCLCTRNKSLGVNIRSPFLFLFLIFLLPPRARKKGVMMSLTPRGECPGFNQACAHRIFIMVLVCAVCSSLESVLPGLAVECWFAPLTRGRSPYGQLSESVFGSDPISHFPCQY